MAKPQTRRRVLIALVLCVAAVGSSPGYFVCMPGPAGGTKDARAPAGEWEQGLETRLRGHVEALATEIGGRGTTVPEALEQAAQTIEAEWEAQGYAVERLPYEVDGQTVVNLAVELPGQGDEVVVVGAHYDSAGEMPGADDNASGVAALLELSSGLTGTSHPRTIRFVAFVNEEPPHFQTESMGSLVYAKSLRDTQTDVTSMLSLETIGYFKDEPGTQHYPPVFGALYPDTGDFIGFVGSTGSVRLVRRATSKFRRVSAVRSYGVAAPMKIPGIGWSDHWSFDQVGYSAVMVTDTAPFRNPHYHEPTDLPAELDYAKMTEVVAGLREVVVDLATY